MSLWAAWDGLTDSDQVQALPLGIRVRGGLEKEVKERNARRREGPLLFYGRRLEWPRREWQGAGVAFLGK